MGKGKERKPFRETLKPDDMIIDIGKAVINVYYIIRD